ncbi:unnamed protein product [Diabrotica balteata]|uniref:Uncharacterized protein n=1 Tax=Diabrotica balteata TaxID=107213 RepID=A0A9N9XD71_DIABA|nr:unnamed protein product [Diabrotica balteata]
MEHFKKWLQINSTEPIEKMMVDTDTQVDADASSIAQKPATTECGTQTDAWHGPPRAVRVTSLEGVNNFADFQRHSLYDWPEKVFKKTTIEVLNPLDSKCNVKVVALEPNDPKMMFSVQRVYRDRYPDLPTLERDFEVLENSTTVRREGERRTKVEKVIKLSASQHTRATLARSRACQRRDKTGGLGGSAPQIQLLNMAEGIIKCDVGNLTKSECHLNSYTKEKHLYKLEKLSAEEIVLLKYRIDNYYTISEGTICDHHKCIYLTYFTTFKYKCCDPFTIHPKNITTNLRILQLETCKKAMESLLLKLKPGDKICINCMKILNAKTVSMQVDSHISDQIDSVESISNPEPRRSERIPTHKDVSYCDDELSDSQKSVQSNVSVVSEFTLLSQEHRDINSVLSSLHMLSFDNQQFSKTKRIYDAEFLIQGVCTNFAKIVAKAGNVNISVPEPVTRNILEDSSVLKEIFKNLQHKFESSTTLRERLEYLALLPINWNRRKIRQYFNCTDYMYQKLSKFRKMDDQIDSVESISNPEPRRSERIPTHKDVSYCDDELSDSQKSVQSNVSVVSEFTLLSQEHRDINSVLSSLHMLSFDNQQFSKTKRIYDAEFLIQGVCTNFAKIVAKAGNVNISVPEPVTRNILEDSSVLKEIFKNLQHKFESSTTLRERLEYLALLPINWNRRKIRQYFNCTDYMYQKLSKFRKMDGFPENIKTYLRKKYTIISEELQNQIKDYYVSNENVYTFPGKRDYVISHDDQGRNILIQKKLLLYTVHDLYLKFKQEYSGSEKVPSFSFFAALKPVECIHAGDPGSHTICVCAQHQNVKLKLNAISKKLNYRDLLAGAVCIVDEEKCMTNQCKKCPRQLGVQQTFEKILKELDIKLSTEPIKYKNWIEEGSSALLQSFEENAEYFKTQLCKDIDDLTFHHFVADSQKRYLSDCKNKLDSYTCIILMDFSENYSFIIQQSVQAFYYNNSQATVHPFCIYFKNKESDQLLNVNYCMISDTKDHLAYTINAFTAKLMAEIKEKYSWIKNVIYFSDGAPQQYKNKVLWVPNNEVQKYECHLRKRFNAIKTFPNTRKHHSYIPVEGKQMIMKFTSFSEEQKIIDIDLE